MLKKLKRFNKIQKLSFIALALVLFSVFAGGSYAWLISEDSVNNHFIGKSYYVEIELLEPNWDSVGSLQAQSVQPGMDIFKDPRVLNISQDECYVRMKVEITDSDGAAVSDELYRKIFDALGTYDNDSDKIIGGISSDFTLYDGWYYYTKGNDECVTLKTNDVTTPLFTDVVIPSLKSEYTGVFDSVFNINVVAEAVFSVNEGFTVEEAAKRFDGTAYEAAYEAKTFKDETASGGAAQVSYADEETISEESEVLTEEAIAELYEEAAAAEPAHIEAEGEFNLDRAVSDGILSAEVD